MTFIFCLDDNKGMLFNNRRQSRDAKVFEDISNYLTGELYINSFSEKLVSAAGLKYKICDDYTTLLDTDAIYLAENISISEHLEKVDKIIFYWWNRKYPGDFFLDFDPAANGFHCASKEEFAGKSHDKITKEVYVR